MKQIAFITAIFLLFGCDNLNEKVKLVNNSSNHLYYQVLTDTTLYIDLYLDDFPVGDTVRAGIIGGEGVWEHRINNKSIDSSLYVFVFCSKELDSDIIQNQNYWKKGFSVEDLNCTDWIITYPDDFK